MKPGNAKEIPAIADVNGARRRRGPKAADFPAIIAGANKEEVSARARPGFELRARSATGATDLRGEERRRRPGFKEVAGWNRIVYNAPFLVSG